MIEKRMIAITAYRTPDGAPTCAVDFDNGGICHFLTSRKFATVDVCAVCRVDIARADGGMGYMIPVDGCPVWAGEVAK